MKKNVVNLSDKQSREAGGQPKVTITCKFILLAANDSEFLILGDLSEFPYHANLLERFCDLRSIPVAWRRKPDIVEILGRDVRMLGGGWLKMSALSRKIRFYGESKVYGPFAKGELTGILSQTSDFRGWSILTE